MSVDPQIITLTPDQAARYHGWLAEAFARAEHYIGTEVEGFFEPLLEMDAFIREQNSGQPITPALEQEFARAAGYAAPERAEFNAILGFAAASFNRRVLEQGAGIDGMIALLGQAGAKIMTGGSDFIRTKPKSLTAPITGAKKYQVVLQPRLSWLVQGLREIGIYPEDLVIHVRDKDPNKLKVLPHLLIEIPRLGGKQIAINNQKGEVTLVSQTRYELEMWERLTKYQLKHVPDISAVVLRKRDLWLARILALLRDGDVRPAAKVDLDKDINAPKRKAMTYSVALIAESIKAAYAVTGEYPSLASGIIEHGPLANGVRTWVSVDSAMKSIWREKDPVKSSNGLMQENCPYSSLGSLRDALGLNDHYTLADIIMSIKATHAVTGRYPNVKSGIIEYGPLANGVRTWTSVDDAMRAIWAKSPRKSSAGLTQENCPYGTLAALKDALGLSDDYTLKDIIESIKATHAVTGEYPILKSGVIEHGPLVNGVRTWGSVNNAMKSIWGKFSLKSANGLTRDNCDCKCLVEVRQKYILAPVSGPSIPAIPAPQPV